MHPPEPRPVAVGPRLAVARDAEQDHPGVALAQLLVAEAPLGQRAGAEVLDHHVRDGGEPLDELHALGRVQVGGDGLLAAPDDRPAQRAALVERAHLTQRVAAAGQLDLDDLGTEVGQQRRRVTGGEHRAQTENPHPCQRTLIGGH